MVLGECRSGRFFFQRIFNFILVYPVFGVRISARIIVYAVEVVAIMAQATNNNKNIHKTHINRISVFNDVFDHLFYGASKW